MLLGISLAILLFGPSLAKHVTCFWEMDGLPTNHGFKLFLNAERFGENETHAVWQTADDYTEIASWGHLRPDIVEIASPCSSHGWDYKRTGRCQPKRWAACWVKAVLPHQNTVHCYYLTGKDDCEWPGKFAFLALPERFNIFADGDRGCGIMEPGCIE